MSDEAAEVVKSLRGRARREFADVQERIKEWQFYLPDEAICEVLDWRAADLIEQLSAKAEGR